jgi:cell wall-associated NlpC family hydrolase
VTVLDTARSLIGTPYVWGGKRPETGLDCSGFISWVEAQNGVSVPSFTDSIADAVPQVGDLQLADILLYRYNDPQQPNVRFPHTEFYSGNGMAIGARFPSGVAERPLLAYPYEIHRPGAAPATADTVPAGDQVVQLLGDNVNLVAMGAAGLALLWALDLL